MSEQLTTKQFEEWKEILLKEKNEATRIINDVKGIIKDSSKLAALEANGSSYSENYSMDLENRETQLYILKKENKRIEDINIALKRIYEKSFGVCKICGEFIPHKRLEIIPYAKFCITCQEAEEAKNR